MAQESRWSWLMSAFLEQVGGVSDVRTAEPNDSLAFEHDGLVLRMIPHPEQPWLMLSVEILALDPVFDEQLNHERLHILHQLNAVSYFDQRAMAVVTPSDLLVLCAHLDLRALEPQELIEQVNSMVERAKLLRDSWGQLGQLLRQDAVESLSADQDITPTFV